MDKNLVVALENSVFPIQGIIQHYDWGGQEFIPQLVGFDNQQKESCAELWIGTHDRGPAKTILDGQAMSLKELIDLDAEKVLGKAVVDKFGPNLPFLFKVLDVNKMLSIQLHPTKAAAEEGFARENELGIPLTARHRNFKDNNHKPEVMIALTDFWLLHGFQSAEAIASCLERIPEFEILRSKFEDKSILKLYRYVMELAQEEVDAILRPLVQRLSKAFAQGELEKSQADYWAARAIQGKENAEEALDRGIFSIYFFNLVHVKKGEAIFQDAGIPHAYLEGCNIELMANSDNVFRGGLTRKHIDVAEMMKHLVTDPVQAQIIQAEKITDTEKVFPTTASDFLLSCIELQQGQTHQSEPQASAAAMIVLEGTVQVNFGDQVLTRQRGEIFFTLADARYQITTNTQAVLYKASVPV